MPTSVLRRHGTDRLWHYTLCAHLPSIIEFGGILSRAELQRRGIHFTSSHYYGDPEKEQILAGYVSCAFMPPWGMMQDEEEELAVLGLDPAVVDTPGTCFCPGWSPQSIFAAAQIVTSVGPEDTEALYTGPGYLTVNGAEVFVPREISVSHVREVVFFDDESRDRAREAMIAAYRTSEHVITHRIELDVAPWRFPRQWQSEGPPWMSE